MEEVCRRLDGITAGDRVGGLADGVDDRLTRCAIVSTTGSSCSSGPGAGLERHQTLAPRGGVVLSTCSTTRKGPLLERCSVFAGGFDLQSACAVAGSDGADEYAVLDLLDALVRKSLLVADQSTGKTRYSMLETIRQFAEEQLVARGEATEASSGAPRVTSPIAKPKSWGRWDSPRQREAYQWFATELANLRTAFRWAADHGDLDVAATIATYAGFSGSVSRTTSRWPGQRS